MNESMERISESPEELAEQERSPLEDMPPFEEHMRTFEPFGTPAESPVEDDISEIIDNKQLKGESVDKASPSEEQSMAYMPFGEPVDKTKNGATASKVEISQPAETQPEKIVNREQVYAGERSSIYRVEKEDGKKTTQVESEYFDIAEMFRKSHDEVKGDFELGLAMDGLSVDLALVDATRGKIFERSNEKQIASLLEDYSTLRSLLDDPEADPKKKDLIRDYFEKVDGDALHFLEERYTPEQAKPIEEEEKSEKEKKLGEEEKPEEEPTDEEDEAKKELEERKETLSRTLDDLKINLEMAKNGALEDSSLFDRATAQMKELLEDRRMNMDLDELNAKLRKLEHAAEDLSESNMRFKVWNNEYGDTVYRNRDIIDENELVANLNQTNDNTDIVMRNSRKLNEADDRIARVRSYIRSVEEAYEAFRRF